MASGRIHLTEETSARHIVLEGGGLHCTNMVSYYGSIHKPFHLRNLRKNTTLDNERSEDTSKIRCRTNSDSLRVMLISILASTVDGAYHHQT